MEIVLHPHKTLLHKLPDSWDSLFVQFIPYMNRVFTLANNSSMSSQGRRTTARSNMGVMAAELVCCWLCDKRNRSVDESGCLDHAKHIVSLHNSSQDDVARSRNPLQAYIFIRLAWTPCWQFPEPFTHSPHLCYRITSPSMIYSIVPTLVLINMHVTSTTRLLTTIPNLNGKAMPSGCRNQLSQILL